jgi:hypothetical protein
VEVEEGAALHWQLQLQLALQRVQGRGFSRAEGLLLCEAQGWQVHGPAQRAAGHCWTLLLLLLLLLLESAWVPWKRGWWLQLQEVAWASAPLQLWLWLWLLLLLL